MLIARKCTELKLRDSWHMSVWVLGRISMTKQIILVNWQSNTFPKEAEVWISKKGVLKRRWKENVFHSNGTVTQRIWPPAKGGFPIPHYFAGNLLIQLNPWKSQWNAKEGESMPGIWARFKWFKHGYLFFFVSVFRASVCRWNIQANKMGDRAGNVVAVYFCFSPWKLTWLVPGLQARFSLSGKDSFYCPSPLT